MPFPNQGNNHFNGIKNEKDVVKWMNEYSKNNINKYLEQENNSLIKLWKHEGGTQQKKDASFQLNNDEIWGVSIKNHDKGTFDWENTTKGVPIELKKKIEDFKIKNKDIPIPEKGGIRDELENIFSSHLDNLSSLEINDLLNKHYQKEHDTKYIIINDMKSKSLILINKSSLDKYFNSLHNHNFILKSTSRAKTSRQIWIKTDDGNEINTNLRIRLHLNNGITALLGKSNANKSSVPCLKIQQDNVDKFINNCENKISVSHNFNLQIDEEISVEKMN